MCFARSSVSLTFPVASYSRPTSPWCCTWPHYVKLRKMVQYLSGAGSLTQTTRQIHWPNLTQTVRYRYAHLPHYWKDLTGNHSDHIDTAQSWYNPHGPLETTIDTVLLSPACAVSRIILWLLDWPSSREIPYSTGPRKGRYIRLAPVRGDWQRFLISEQFEGLGT